MSDVKRYDLEQPDSYMGSAKMQREDYGDWVSFEDYAALRARLAEVERELKTLKSDRMFVVGFNAGYSACLEQMSEAACVRHSFDGFGWQYSDASNGSDWFSVAMTMPDAEPLYESPDKMSVCADLSPAGGNDDD